MGKIARAQKYSPSYFNTAIQGDFNSDSIIDILDVILALDIILNIGTVFEDIDLNNDGNGDIFDIIILVSIILQN